LAAAVACTEKKTVSSFIINSVVCKNDTDQRVVSSSTLLCSRLEQPANGGSGTKARAACAHGGGAPLAAAPTE
jgi:hypothetical protein